MNLATTLKLLTGDIKATSAGAMGPPDSRYADKWIKNWLDQKADRQNKLRQELHRTIDPQIKAAYHVGKNVLDQDPRLIADGGRWSVQAPDGLIISTHADRDTANRAASGKRYARVVDLGPEFEYRKKGPLGKELEINKLVDDLRDNDVRPSSLRYTIGSR